MTPENKNTFSIVKIQIDGMSCSNCAGSVEKSLNDLDGISSAQVDLKSKTASIKYDDKLIKIGDIKKTIIDLGYLVA